MANNSTKGMSSSDEDQVLRFAFSDEDRTIAVGSFVGLQVGHKVVRNVISSTVDDFEFYDGSTLLKTIRVTFTNAAHDDLVSAERTV